MGISPCTPSRIGRKVSIPHDSDFYRLRHRIENMFSRLKDWRRIATRYDKLARNFLATTNLVGSLYWIKL
mgnify:CR=1 FL=1